jgi:hypothetical protein
MGSASRTATAFCTILTLFSRAAGSEHASVPKTLTVEQVRNARVLDVQLTDGAFHEEEDFPDGGHYSHTVGLEDIAIGDLDGDGWADAVVEAGDGGGSGVFTFLVFLKNVRGHPVERASVCLADRQDAESIHIRRGRVVVDATVHGPDDAMMDPTRRVRIVYTLAGKKLVEVERQDRSPGAASVTPTAEPTNTAAPLGGP